MDESSIPTRRRARRSEREIAQLLELFEGSGQTQAAFCREHGLSVASLCAWRRKRREADAPPGFRAVRVGGFAPAAAGPLIRLPDGIEIVLPAGVSASELCRIVAALKESAPW
jgi:hypothetical protein